MYFKRCRFIFLILIMFVMITNVNAFNSKTKTIVQGGSRVVDEATNYGLAVKKDADEVYVCTLYRKDTPAGRGLSCTLNDDWNLKTRIGVAAILNASSGGYKTDSVTSEYFAAEMAVNQFLYEKNGNNSDNHILGAGNLATAYRTLYNQYLEIGKKAYDNADTTVNFSISTNKLTFTRSGNNYISNTINVTTNAGYEASTNIGSIQKNGNSFYVVVPLSSFSTEANVSVSVVSGVKKYSIARNYTCGSDYQTLTPAHTEEVTTDAKRATATGSISRTKLIIRKVDEKGNLVAGAKIRVENEDKSYSKEFTTSTTPIEILDIPNGKYTITEISAPNGFVIDSRSQTVTINDSSATATVTLTNKLVKAIISKKDITGTKELPGATLEIQDKDGKIVKYCGNGSQECKWVSTSEDYVVEGLPNGTYYLVETIAPTGYVLSKEKVKFIVDGSNDTIKVVMKNKLTRVEISKINLSDSKPLKGATLEIQDKDGKIVKYCGNGSQECKWVSTNDAYVIEGLPNGTYYLVETIAPTGYILNKEKVKFTVDGSNDTIKVVMKNKLTRVEISKIRLVDGKLLKGATLEIQDKDGKVVKYCVDKDGNKNKECRWTSSNEVYVIEGLPKGKYYLVEIAAPEGYELNKDKIEFEITDKDQIVKVEMKNDLKVDVPDTLGSKSALLLTIAMFDIALGIGLVTYVKKNKIEE